VRLWAVITLQTHARDRSVTVGYEISIERVGDVNRMIAEFSARQWKQRTLFDLVSKVDSTGSCFNVTPDLDGYISETVQYKR